MCVSSRVSGYLHVVLAYGRISGSTHTMMSELKTPQSELYIASQRLLSEGSGTAVNGAA